MNQLKSASSVNKPKIIKDIHEGQVAYLGRWVNKEHFRVFVYDEDGVPCIAKNYAEYEEMISSGLWFAEKPEKKVASTERKQKHDTLRAIS